MKLKSKEIYEKLKARFPDKNGAYSPAKPEDEGAELAGDPFVVVQRDDLVALCGHLKNDPELMFDFLADVSGADDGKDLWVIYHLYSVKHNHKFVLKVNVGRQDPWVPTLTQHWGAANWHERETYDLFGIRFEGHPDLRRILLPEDWVGHPLRKDYEFPDDYQGIPLK